ncbi:RNA-guided endonuclease InsQ/TnpB family protein [Embleya sp. NPDC001921]
MAETVLRTYRFALDPTSSQLLDLARHAGAARWAYNWANAHKLAAHEARRGEIGDLVAVGHTQESARKHATIRVPNKATVQKHLNSIKGDSRHHVPGPESHGPHRPCAWWHEVSTHALQSAMTDCDTAWDNWAKAASGRRAGAAMGFPRFKRKGRSRDSFRLYGRGLRFDGHRRIGLPRLGSVRLHESAKRLVRLIDRGTAAIKNVTVARGGSRWYACVLAEVTMTTPSGPTRAQRDAGTVGVDLGVSTLVTLSRPLDPSVPSSDRIANPRWLVRDTRRLRKAQQKLTRTRAGSGRRRKAASRFAAVHARIAERRAGHLHQITKRIVTGFTTIGVERFDLVGLTRSAHGTIERPGTNVGVKARFNRHLLDAALGETRRQLGYKSPWYGARTIFLDPGTSTNRLCSSCGWENPPRRPSADRFTCGKCGLKTTRSVNSARNIQRMAHELTLVAPDTEETRNARGADTADDTAVTSNVTASMREGPYWVTPVK